MRIGIMSAMLEEIETLLEAIETSKITERGGRKYYEGNLWGIDVVLVFSHWGKVASASTVTHLIVEYKVDAVIFSGVAGAIDIAVNIGDVVIGDHLYQHDMDARPLYKQFEIPLIDRSFFKTDETINARLQKAATQFLSSEMIPPELRSEFGIDAPKVVSGAIASGDKFIAGSEEASRIKKGLPDVLCVEMEGGAVAQVCYEYDIPFSIIRTISDTADHNADMDFMKFVKEVASQYSMGILRNYFQLTTK